MNLRSLRSKVLQELQKEYPIEEAQSFFYILSQHFLGMSRLEVALELEKRIAPEQVRQFMVAVDRLMDYEPIQYIIGETEFYGLRFAVNQNVLIPRPETEELVQWILTDAVVQRAEKLRILDIGTGSGCIAVSLAKNLPSARVTALDHSVTALETAERNAEKHQVEIEFLRSDILQASSFPGNFDVIVSNPPYVREIEKLQMHPNVLNYEPSSALYVPDEDPLIFYRQIASLAVSSEKRPHLIFLEVNQYLARQTEELLQEKSFTTTLKRDIFGEERMLRGESK